MMPTELPECGDRRYVGDEQFFCERHARWFPRSGLECNRCKAGLPVTVEAYREHLRRQRKGRT